MRTLRSASHVICVGIAAAIGATAAAAAQLQAPAGGQVYALIVGIDHYPHIRELKGAQADAQDLDESLRRAGVSNVNHIPERSATRQAVIAAMNNLIGQSKANDLVIISFAGHGMQLPERVKGSKPDGLDEAYLLYNFDPASRLAPDLIIGPEMKHFLGQFEAKSVDVLFIVDSCFGGGMTRNWDPRSGDFTYRKDDSITAAAAAALSENLAPLSTPADSFQDESNFKHVTFLAAVDKNTPSPEVDIPGEKTKRGALSYAVARAIEGAATGQAGTLTRRTLFSNTRQVVLQYSNNRQVIATEPENALDAMVWRTGAAAAGPSNGPQPDPNPVPEQQKGDKQAVRVAVVNGVPSLLSNVQTIFTPFVVVGNTSDAQLVWDAGKKEALVGGDVIAHDIGASDVPAVVDRTWALDSLAKLSERVPQSIEVLPNNSLHRNGEIITVRANDVQNKYAIIFNIAGDGTVQFLYPLGNDRPQMTTAAWQIDNPPIKVSEPYGSDTVIAVTSDQRQVELEAALRKLDNRRAAGQVPRLLATYAPQAPSYRVGLARVFTAP